MSILLRLANRMILSNTRHEIDPEARGRVAIPCGHDEIEAWTVSKHAAAAPQSGDTRQPQLFLLKFPGTGGRAERGGPHPGELLGLASYEVWTINPPGYGTSVGAACVKKMPATCDAAWSAISERAAGKPVLVTGNSLGGMYALYVAARYPVAGVFLRNPAPVHELIRGEYSWWNFGLAARWIGAQVPDEMNSISNARRCSAPAFFVMSENDRTVPPKYQQQIVDNYGGKTTTFTLCDAEHHTPVSEKQADNYRASVACWREAIEPGVFN